jgi:tRNA 2-thiouridine synthesizing protein B
MLHIVNKSPFDTTALAAVLRVANKQGSALLLIEDGVYAAAKNSSVEASVKAAGMPVYVLQPDAEARGLMSRLMDGVTMVDYGGFVDLVAGQDNVQSWL